MTYAGLIMLHTRGDSMESTIGNGDLVMIGTMERDLSDGIYAFVLAGAALVKRFAVTMQGIDVLSDNPAYSSEKLLREQDSDFQVIGRVRWIGRVLG